MRTTTFGRIVENTKFRQGPLLDTGCWKYISPDGSYTDLLAITEYRRTTTAALGRPVENPVALCKCDTCVAPHHMAENLDV